MTRSRYIVGIDLGTTNCAVAYVDTKGRDRPTADVKTFAVPQLVAAGGDGAAGHAPVVPVPAGPARAAPRRGAIAVGRRRGPDRRRVRPDPGRRGSRRTWSAAPRAGCAIPASTARPTSSRGVAPAEARRVSPVEASADYLRHIRDAWDVTFALEDPRRAPGEAGDRPDRPRLVRRGRARADGRGGEAGEFPNLTLLEEPQAAFYCWIVTHQEGGNRRSGPAN